MAADTQLLESINPFCFLSRDERGVLLRELDERRYADGETIIRQDDVDDTVFLIASGSVETRDASTTPPTVLGRIDAGHYFGERAVLFGEARRLEVRSCGESRVFSMKGERFLRILSDSRVFAQALAEILREKQGIFGPFDLFLAELARQISRSEIRLAEILPLYLDLVPALHPYAANPHVVDWGALSYAVRRLPTNVTQTFAYFLTDNFPSRYRTKEDCFTAIHTPARPRTTYEMMPGKSMVLIRDGLSDLVDFVTCLCVYSIEVRKIRQRLGTPDLITKLEAGAPLEDLPFEAVEIARLKELWPDGTTDRLRAIEAHHEDFALHITKERANYNSRHSEVWSAQIAQATSRLMGTEPFALPEDLPVHIISSNTHSVTNCVSAYLVRHAEDILTWAKRSGHRFAAESWNTPMDLVFTLARDWLAHDPQIAKTRADADAKAGIAKLRQTAFTGIEVELIDTARLVDAGPIDPQVTPPSKRRALIVNIDFAFGQQAAEIIGNLVSLFGRRIASVNVLGKAGALVGARGDVLVPTRFLEQATNTLHPLAALAKTEEQRLQGRLGSIGLHVGPMLTVTGTLLQNRMMLRYYKHLAKCIGLEMEGSFYHRKLFESVELGVLREDVTFRYLYYVSDLPLDHTSNLSGRMHPREGVPPLYAITREILSGIFDSLNG